MWDQLGSFFASTVLTGPMLAALPVAAIAGFISFASPCVLPLLPGYVGSLSGMAGVTTPGTRLTGGPQTKVRDRRLLAGVLLFVAGFTAVFVLLGVIFAWLGILLAPWLDLTTRILGALVVLMGLAFMGYVPLMQRDRRLHLTPRQGLWGAPLLGVVFGLGWAPCMGPTLAAVLSLAFSEADPARGGVLVFAYSLGLGIPFIAGAMLLSARPGHWASCAATTAPSSASAAGCSSSSDSRWSPACGPGSRATCRASSPTSRPSSDPRASVSRAIPTQASATRTGSRTSGPSPARHDGQHERRPTAGRELAGHHPNRRPPEDTTVPAPCLTRCNRRTSHEAP